MVSSAITQPPKILLAKANEANKTDEKKEKEPMTAIKIVNLAKSPDGYNKVKLLAAEKGLTLTNINSDVQKMGSYLENEYSGHTVVLAALINLFTERGMKVKGVNDQQPPLITITESVKVGGSISVVKDGEIIKRVKYDGLGDSIYKPRLRGDKVKIQRALMGASVQRFIEKGGTVKGETIDEMFNSIVEPTTDKENKKGSNIPDSFLCS